MILAAATVAVAQQPPQTPPQPQAEKLTPKVPSEEVAKLKYELEEQKAKTAWAEVKNLQQQAGTLQQNYQTTLQTLQKQFAEQQKVIEAYKDSVCKENGWNCATVNYDPESGAWTKPPKPAETAKAPVKPPATKPAPIPVEKN
jgi:hypothetical protein